MKEKIINENPSAQKSKNDFFTTVKTSFAMRLEKMLSKYKRWTLLYLFFTIIAAGICFTLIGRDLLPTINSGQFQLRIRKPDGTRLERTEKMLSRKH